MCGKEWSNTICIDITRRITLPSDKGSRRRLPRQPHLAFSHCLSLRQRPLSLRLGVTRQPFLWKSVCVCAPSGPVSTTVFTQRSALRSAVLLSTTTLPCNRTSTFVTGRELLIKAHVYQRLAQTALPSAVPSARKPKHGSDMRFYF